MKYDAYDLDYLEEYTIYCESCGREDSSFEIQPEGFFRDGWRMTKNNNQYCPECANKKLKNVKQQTKRINE